MKKFFCLTTFCLLSMYTPITLADTVNDLSIINEDSMIPQIHSPSNDSSTTLTPSYDQTTEAPSDTTDVDSADETQGLTDDQAQTVDNAESTDLDYNQPSIDEIVPALEEKTPSDLQMSPIPPQNMDTPPARPKKKSGCGGKSSYVSHTPEQSKIEKSSEGLKHLIYNIGQRLQQHFSH